MTTLYEREIQDPEMARLLAQEELIEEATELVAKTMKQRGVAKTELARRVGTSKANVTQLLAGSRNMTLRTFADLMYAMAEKVVLTSTCAVEGKSEKIICWAVKSPRSIVAHTWEETELLVGAGGHAA